MHTVVAAVVAAAAGGGYLVVAGAGAVEVVVNDDDTVLPIRTDSQSVVVALVLEVAVVLHSTMDGWE